MRRTAKPIHYYVEGECEEKLINALKVGRDNKIAAGNLSPLLLRIWRKRRSYSAITISPRPFITSIPLLLPSIG